MTAEPKRQAEPPDQPRYDEVWDALVAIGCDDLAEDYADGLVSRSDAFGIVAGERELTARTLGCGGAVVAAVAVAVATAATAAATVALYY